MAYSSLFTQKQKKIPLIGVVVALILILISLSTFLKTPPVPSRANTNVLKNVALVNVSSNQAGITWTSAEPETAWLLYSDNEKDISTIALDERDVAQNKNKYKNHYVQLRNLKPSTTYFYKIVVNSQLIADNNNKAFVFKTMSEVAGRSTAKPAYGKVLQKNGQPESNVFVFITTKTAYPLFTLTKESGEWLISLSAIYDKTSGKQIFMGSSDIVDITFRNDEGVEAHVSADTSNISPLPQTVLLGNRYTFTDSEVLGAQDRSGSQNNTSTSFSITYPKEKSVIPGQTPLIKGVASPNTSLEISVSNSTITSQKTISDKNGDWSFPIRTSLPAGEHNLTVLFRDTANKQVMLSRLFTIAKSGEQVVLGEATAAASPTGQATLTPTSVPTISTFPTDTIYASSTPTIPVTGSNSFPLIAASAFLILMGIGLLVAF